MKKWNKSDKSRKTKRGAIGIQSHKSCPKKERWFLPEVLTGHESWTSSPASATNSSTSAVEKFCEELTGRDIKTMRCHNCSFFMAKKMAVIVGGNLMILLHVFDPFVALFGQKWPDNLSKYVTPALALLSGRKITTNAGGWRVMDRWRNYGGRLPTHGF